MASILRERKPTTKEERVSIGEHDIWARLYFRPIRLSANRAVLVLLEDLTFEKRQIQLMNKIKRAKKEWERTFDTVQDFIAIVDRKHKIVRLNKAAALRA